MADRDIQYKAVRDSAGTWRILDTWNDSVQALDGAEDIPDSHDALTVITEGQYLAIVREATKEGFLQSAALSEVQALEAEVGQLTELGTGFRIENEKLISQVELLEAELENLRKYDSGPTRNSALSESAQIKMEIIQSLRGLAQGENLTGILD